MKKLVLSTDNKNKLKEIRELCRDLEIEILSKSDVNLKDLEVEETEDTLEGNARLKVKAIAQEVDYNIIGDDTGLFIDALDGAPGVFSARFAGGDDSANRKKVLDLLKNEKNRSAYFKTVIILIDEDKKEYLFEGICKGEITEEEYGEGGFGYDKIFKPNNSDRTFGEMTLEEKNKYSHRAKALKNFINYFKEI